MTQPAAVPAPALARRLTLRDMVLLNIVAVISLRWLATSAATGPSALVLWVLAAVFVFGPMGLAVSALSVRYPEAGGLYAWTKRAYGEKHGFLCGWCYWVNNLLYYPNLLLSTAAIATYAFGRGGTGLENDLSFVLPATLLMLWLAATINIVGVGTGRTSPERSDGCTRSTARPMWPFSCRLVSGRCSCSSRC